MTHSEIHQAVPLMHRIPMTRVKFYIARVVFGLIRIFLKDDRCTITRNGLAYHVDLSEGIDLSLFLFGAFQKHVTRPRYYALPESAVILDVGANIGAMTLPYAAQVPCGHVYAFEPDPLVHDKLLKNVSLNPRLAGRITASQQFVSDRTLDAPTAKEIHSSWSLTGQKGDRHPLHAGIRKEIPLVAQVSLDDFCRKKAIKKVDLIKIDTDGHELPVIKGCREVMKTSRPVIIFEAGLYTTEKKPFTFRDIYELLTQNGYRLVHSKNGKEITPANYLKQIPKYYTIDIIALPG